MTVRRHPRPNRRGFTILEVVVALSAGVLVSMATFTLSKNATAFFQREARISSAQLALTLAMNRLTNDIQRASFLSTTNIQLDPNVCRTTAGTWPAGLSVLGGLNISVGTQTSQGAIQPQAFTAPDQIIIGGAMDMTDAFQVQTVTAGAGGAPLLVMRLPTADPLSYRTVASLGPTETLGGKIAPMFNPNTYPTPAAISGRIGHIYHPESNWHWFGVIQSYSVNAVSGAVTVQFQQTPTIPGKPATCGIGIGDTGGGWLFNVVSRVQYSIQPASTAVGPPGPTNPYSQILAPPTDPKQALVTGDAGRTELFRSEIDPSTNQPISGSTELVAEYAVDLRFGITTVLNPIQNDAYVQKLYTYPFGDAHVYSITNSPQLGGTPQYVRGVQVRLSTRTRAPDSSTDLPTGLDGRRLRWLINPNLQPAFARVRTNYANVALPNQGGFSLW
jgi:type II secretory pathway pseudopilin PulG